MQRATSSTVNVDFILINQTLDSEQNTLPHSDLSQIMFRCNYSLCSTPCYVFFIIEASHQAIELSEKLH